MFCEILFDSFVWYGVTGNWKGVNDDDRNGTGNQDGSLCRLLNGATMTRPVINLDQVWTKRGRWDDEDTCSPVRTTVVCVIWQ